MTFSELGTDISDPYRLNRFVVAQKDTYQIALNELKTGKKLTHWMWFVFPQIDGLGYSTLSKLYSIKSLGEGRAYLNHSLLGPRLAECVEAVASLRGRTILDIFGTPDDLKFHASITLFEYIAGYDSIFYKALNDLFGGARHDRTIQIIENIAANECVIRSTD